MKKLFQQYWRFYSVISFFALAGILLIIRLIDLHIYSQEFLNAQGDARILRNIKIPAYRGLILDRNNEPLAISAPIDSIWLNGREIFEYQTYLLQINDESEIKAEQQKWLEISKLIEMEPLALQSKLYEIKNKNFYYLKRGVSPATSSKIEQLNIKGLYKIEEYRRFYPSQNLFAQVLGWTDLEDKGIEGLERVFDADLTGENGIQQIIKNAKGKTVQFTHTTKAVKSGKNITLSLDSRLQKIAFETLQTTVEERQAESASLITIDIKTGEILAMVNYPSFNPNNLEERVSNYIRNRAVLDLFEPGSTIKPFSVIAALDSGRWNENSTVNVAGGKLTIGQYTIKDVSSAYNLDLKGILMKSSNVGISKVALDIGGDRLYSTFLKAGFGSRSNLQFPSERPSFLPNHKKWPQVDVAALSYGYGMSVSLLHLAHAYAIIANNGKSVDLSILKVHQEEKVGKQVLNEQSVKKVQKMLQSVVNEQGGGGARAAINHFIVAGKSGTARKIKNGKYQEDAHRSLFVGFLPANSPRYVTAIMVDDPKGTYFGGAVAAPVFQEVMSQFSHLLQIKTDY